MARAAARSSTFLVEAPGQFGAVTLHPDEDRSRDRAGSRSPACGRCTRSCIRSASQITSSGSSRTASRSSRSISATWSRTDVRYPPLRSPDACARDRRLADRVPRDPRGTAARALGARSHRHARGARARHARSVHTIGMRASIDVVVLDRDWRTLRVHLVQPGRVVVPRPGPVTSWRSRQGEAAFISALDGRTIRAARDSARPTRTAGGSRRRTRPGPGLPILRDHVPMDEGTITVDGLHLVGHRDLL